MRKTLVVLIAVAAIAACKKEKKEASAGAAASSTPQTPAEGQPGPQSNRPPPMRRQVVPITVDEVKAMIPTLEGGKVMKPVGKAERGERVETTMCFEKGELLAIAEQLKAKLTAAGWPTVNVRQHPQITDRVGVNAHKPPYVFYGAVQRGPYPDCTKDKGQSMVTLSVHKIESVPGSATPGPRVPGAPGLSPQLPRPMHPVLPHGPAGASSPH
jgi:hypothetical protein